MAAKKGPKPKLIKKAPGSPARRSKSVLRPIDWPKIWGRLAEIPEKIGPIVMYASVTIKIIPDYGPTPWVVKAAEGPPLMVRWNNKCPNGCTITFSKGWPFVEPPGPIPVAAGGTTGWYHISSSVKQSCVYSVEGCKLGGPPDGPAIDPGGN